MLKEFVQIKQISFSYPGMSAILFENLNVQLSRGWTGVIGGNGTGKTTLLKLITEELKPDRGEIYTAGIPILCHQTANDIPEFAQDFMESSSKESAIIRDRLEIHPGWLMRWTTLSHGERKRVQIGIVLWKNPVVLALDEPTNHLDMYARNLIRDALLSYQGIGLIVSHDRQLLDELCYQCIITEPPRIFVRSGGYSASSAEHEREKQRDNLKYKQQKDRLKKISAEFQRRSAKTKSADRKRSKRGISRRDHDAKEKKDRARISGKDATAGKLMNQMKGRLQQAQKELDGLTFHKSQVSGIWLPSSYSKRNSLIEFDARIINLGQKKKLCVPDIIVHPKDRIGVLGPNGSGKSTLIDMLQKSLDLPEERITWIPQEIHKNKAGGMLEEINSLPSEQLGYLLTIVNRLGTDPKRLRESEAPSPGELRKILLAFGIMREPHIIIMDEPTNHMDIISIQALEDALYDCPCCLILVSHDVSFLRRLSDIRWEFKKAGNEESRINIEMGFFR